MSRSGWVIRPLWLSGSWRSFLYSSSVYSCHLFLISSASVRSIPFLFFYEPIFAWSSLGTSNFLEEISSLSHSIVFLYFFALITEEGFLISPGYSLKICIQLVISFLFSFAFHFLFTDVCKASSDSHFVFLHFFFLGWSWSLPPVPCHESPSIVHQALCLSDLIPWIYLSLHCIIVRDLI